MEADNKILLSFKCKIKPFLWISFWLIYHFQLVGFEKEPDFSVMWYKFYNKIPAFFFFLEVLLITKMESTSLVNKQMKNYQENKYSSWFINDPFSHVAFTFLKNLTASKKGLSFSLSSSCCLLLYFFSSFFWGWSGFATSQLSPTHILGSN